jgi:hypothetical protein
VAEPMEFGLMLPQAGAPWAQLLRFAQRAEELGYDFVWVVDHLQAAPVEAGSWRRRPTEVTVITAPLDLGAHHTATGTHATGAGPRRRRGVSGRSTSWLTPGAFLCRRSSPERAGQPRRAGQPSSARGNIML